MRAQREQRNIKKRRGRNKLICSKKKKEYKIEERKELTFVHRLFLNYYIACFYLILISFFSFSSFLFQELGRVESLTHHVWSFQSLPLHRPHTYSYTHTHTHTHSNNTTKWEQWVGKVKQAKPRRQRCLVPALTCTGREGLFLVLHILWREAAEKCQVICLEFEQLNRNRALITPLGPGPRTFPLGLLWIIKG